MDLSFLSELVLILSISVAVIFACNRIGLAPIVGFLAAGVICGPGGFALVKNVHQVEMMAEIGVVLLLFTIGMELSASELGRLKRPIFMGGGLQAGLTILIVAGIGWFMGAATGKSVFMGFLAALSSTAIVLKELQRRAELESPHGRATLSVLIFQDLAIVPMMLFIPFLSGQGGDMATSLAVMLGKGLGVIAVVIILARFVVPRMFLAVARARSRELFLMATIVFCLAVALLTAGIGLSLSLGAFLAGLMLSESEYALNAMEGVLPFKDIFTSLFFVSVGMLVDVNFIVSHPWTVLSWASFVIAIKITAATLAILALGFPLRVALLGGFALAQVGEFSFVLAKAGMDVNLISRDVYQAFLASSVITMAATPWLIQLGPAVASRLAGKAPRRNIQPDECHEELHDHLILVGYGPGGQRIAHAVRRAGIPYQVLEMNIDTVRREKLAGAPIRYGDASYPAVLEHVGVRQARMLVLVISDPAATRRVVATAHSLNPGLNIIVRTRFVSEVQDLLILGANVVIPEEYETSIEIFTRVLVEYLVPNQTIERYIMETRGASYRMLRTPDLPLDGQKLMSGQLSGMDLAVFTVEAGAEVAGRTLEETGMRREHALTVVAVEREGETHVNPDGGFGLAAGDKVYVFGRQEDVVDKAWLFSLS